MDFKLILRKNWVSFWRNSSCYCWSGKKYKNCCELNEHIPWFSQIEYENSRNTAMLAWKIPPSIFEKFLRKCENIQCIFEWCNETPINCHLIPKNYLKKISIDNHLFTISIKNWLDKVWIKNAFWEKIWCNKHDTEIFLSIDLDFLNFSEKNINLLFYKTISNEFIKKQASLRLSYSLIKLWNYTPSSYYAYLWNYLWYQDFQSFFGIKICKAYIIDLPLKQSYKVIVQWATSLLYWLNKKAVSDLLDFESNPSPCVVVSVPLESQGIQRTLIIAAENDYELYYKNFFQILEESDLATQYRIINNVFLSFENIALIEKNEEFEIKNKKRAKWFLEELTNNDDLLKENIIEFI